MKELKLLRYRLKMQIRDLEAQLDRFKKSQSDCIHEFGAWGLPHTSDSNVNVYVKPVGYPHEFKYCKKCFVRLDRLRDSFLDSCL